MEERRQAECQMGGYEHRVSEIRVEVLVIYLDKMVNKKASLNEIEFSRVAPFTIITFPLNSNIHELPLAL